MLTWESFGRAGLFWSFRFVLLFINFIKWRRGRSLAAWLLEAGVSSWNWMAQCWTVSLLFFFPLRLQVCILKWRGPWAVAWQRRGWGALGVRERSWRESQRADCHRSRQATGRHAECTPEVAHSGGPHCLPGEINTHTHTSVTRSHTIIAIASVLVRADSFILIFCIIPSFSQIYTHLNSEGFHYSELCHVLCAGPITCLASKLSITPCDKGKHVTRHWLSCWNVWFGGSAAAKGRWCTLILSTKSCYQLLPCLNTQ